MNRQAQAAVLFLVGAALLHAGFTNLYLRYVKAGLQPLLLLSGAVLIITALATAWYEWRRTRIEKAHAETHAEAHSEAHTEAEGHDEHAPRWLTEATSTANPASPGS